MVSYISSVSGTTLAHRKMYRNARHISQTELLLNVKQKTTEHEVFKGSMSMADGKNPSVLLELRTRIKHMDWLS
jgi:hypothetical protein